MFTHRLQTVYNMDKYLSISDINVYMGVWVDGGEDAKDGLGNRLLLGARLGRDFN